MDGHLFMAYDYPLLGAFWSLLWFFLWVLWIMLLFRVVFDIFRDHKLGGWAKAGWLLFVIVIPFVGVLVYVIVRGQEMGKREVEHARAQQEALGAYVRETAGGAGGTGGAGHADELARLSQLKDKGDLTEDEFRRAKEKILA